MATVIDQPSVNGSMVVAPVEANPMAMIQTAIERNLDAGQLEKLLDLQERWDKARAAEAFARAMNACQSEMPAIVRDAYNNQTKSKYARLETVNEQIKAIYVRNGFSLSFGTESSPLEKHVRVTCDVLHTGGHTKHYQADFPLDDAGMQGTVNKTPMHATGSTMSYGRRYLIYLIFNLSLANEDNDGNGRRPIQKISEEQVIQIQEWLDNTSANVPVFLQCFSIEKLSDLPANRFQEAIDALRKKQRQQGGRP